MARREPALCKAVTLTAGTGTYTLETTTAAGYQTLAQAVARGLAANGDEIVYRVSDPADPVVYEVAKGTIGSAGMTVTRAAILERDDGTTSPKSWPSGGARNFAVTFWPAELAKLADNGAGYTAATFATNLGLPLLSAANTFAEGQVLSKSVAGAWQALDLRNLATGSGSNTIETRYRFKDDAGNTDIFAQIIAGSASVASGAESGFLNLRVISAGTVTTIASVKATGMEDGGGNRFDAFPTGFVMLAESIPVGWNAGYVTDNRLIRLAKSGDTLGSLAGTGDPFVSWSTDSHVLTIAEIPAHDHDHHHTRAFNLDNFGGATYMQSPAAPGGGNAFNTTTSTGGGGGHIHTIATPKHRVMVRIVKV